MRGSDCRTRRRTLCLKWLQQCTLCATVSASRPPFTVPSIALTPAGGLRNVLRCPSYYRYLGCSQEVVEQLLSWLPPDALSTDGHVLLAEAARMGHVAAVHVLRAWGARLTDPRDGGLGAQLRAAVAGGNARGVAALIAAGVDVNASGSNGNGSANACGGGVAATGGAGSTLLHVAAAQGSLEVVSLTCKARGSRQHTSTVSLV